MDYKQRVERAMHRAHLQYQREALAPSADRNRLACAEVRGVKYRVPKRTLAQQLADAELLRASFSGLRSNFYKAYVETLIYMAS